MDFDRIRARLAALRDADPAHRVFGASAHRWTTAPAPLARVEAFEQRHGVVLPEPYRTFLLEVTDGGAGPGYGLFSLERSPGDDLAEDLSLLSTPFPESEFFALEPPESPDEDEEGDDPAYEAAMDEYWREMPGTLTLCHYGCGIRAYLVVTGPRPGLVLLDQRCDEAGVRPFTVAGEGRWNAWDRPASDDRAPLGFPEWYRDWLDASWDSLKGT